MEEKKIKMKPEDLMIKYNKVRDWKKFGPNYKL